MSPFEMKSKFISVMKNENRFDWNERWMRLSWDRLQARRCKERYINWIYNKFVSSNLSRNACEWKFVSYDVICFDHSFSSPPCVFLFLLPAFTIVIYSRALRLKWMSRYCWREKEKIFLINGKWEGERKRTEEQSGY
jgi:hypothetical protein